MKTAAERKREERARKDALGLRQVVVYVPEGSQELLRSYARKLCEESCDGS